MSDLISKQAAINALDAICDRECEYPKKQRAVMCASCHLGSAFDAIDELPSAEPIDVQEAYYRGKIDGVKECTARLKKVNEEVANG